MLSISLLCRQLKEIFKCSHISPLPHKENQLEENLDQFNTLVMIPVTEEGEGGASEFLSTQIPSHFYFLLMFFLNPKFQNLSPIMQCKREQMGKSYVGKGFGGPQRREIWLLNVSHTNLQLPPALPHDTLRMDPAHGAWRSRLTAGRECNERTVALLVFPWKYE